MNGYTYDGNFKDSFPNGKGVFTFSNGDTYEGDL
jgi:hypothetical protein